MAFANAKICANCQFWGGKRKVSAFKTMAEVSAMSERGVCMNSKSCNSKGKEWRADHINTCGGFQKWDQLK